MFKHQDKRIIHNVSINLFGESCHILQCCFVCHVFLQRFEHSIKNCVFMSGTVVKVSEGHGVFLTERAMTGSQSRRRDLLNGHFVTPPYRPYSEETDPSCLWLQSFGRH